MIERDKKHAFITGGAGGLGGDMAALLVEKGWHVFVSDHNETALARWQGKPGVQTLQMDVTSSESVKKAAAQIAQTGVQLDAVINFAGIMAVGSLTEMDLDLLERIQNVNVMGTVRVNQAFFHLLKRTGDIATSGRLVNIGSETGWVTTAPFSGPYSMSKHAMQAYNNALRRELQLLGVAVINIQPGPFKTDMVGSIGRAFERAIAETTLLKPSLQRVAELAKAEEKKAHPPRVLSEAIFKAMTLARPRGHYSVKADPARVLATYLPERLADWIFFKICKSKKTI